MKVALVSFHSFSRPGGVKNHILGLYGVLKKQKIDCKILVPRRKWWEKYSKDVILLGTSFSINIWGGEADFDIVFTPFSIERVLGKEKFDILHFHNFGFPAGLQFINSPFSQNSLLVLTFHSNLERSKILEKAPFLISLLNKIFNLKIDGLILVSSYLLKFFEEYKKPKVVIPNGIDLERFKNRKEKIRKFLDGKINLLFVGRIEERKGLIYLLQAFKILKERYSNIRLIIVGDGEEEKNCKNFVQKNNIKDVHFLGSKSEKEIPAYYHTCDIFVAPSIFGESFGIVLLEAMAAKKPIVAFNIPGFSEVIKNEKEGFLVENKNVKELAQKIALLIENEKIRKEMGERGWKTVQSYSWEKVGERVLNFYFELQKMKNLKKSF